MTTTERPQCVEHIDRAPRDREELAAAIARDIPAGSYVNLGIGCLIGSRLGPIVVRHAPATPLRILIGAAGVALAVKLGIDAYA